LFRLKPKNKKFMAILVTLVTYRPYKILNGHNFFNFGYYTKQMRDSFSARQGASIDV